MLTNTGMCPESLVELTNINWWNKSNKMQQLRFLFSVALLYVFRMTISAGSTTQNNKTEITYNSTTIELLYYWQI